MIKKLICNNLDEFIGAIKTHREYRTWCIDNDQEYYNRFTYDPNIDLSYNHDIILYEYNCIGRDELNKLKNYSSENNNEIDITNISVIVDEILPNLGEECKRGVLIGLQITEEDMYYIYKTKSGEITYNTCVGGVDA